ncbi:MAG: hypothetical protein K0S39_4730 [Paenibacillus sp.]|nr:hypothetical protein [Paenibacillus sp.]
MEFVWWGINVFLGCLFGLEVFHQRLLHDSMIHKSLHSGALYAFLTFSLISLVVLFREVLPGKINGSFYPIVGLGLPLFVLAMSIPLLKITKKSLNARCTGCGVLTVMAGVKFSEVSVYLLAPVLCTAGVLLLYIGYAISLKKLNQEQCGLQ